METLFPVTVHYPVGVVAMFLGSRSLHVLQTPRPRSLQRPTPLSQALCTMCSRVHPVDHSS